MPTFRTAKYVLAAIAGGVVLWCGCTPSETDSTLAALWLANRRVDLGRCDGNVEGLAGILAKCLGDEAAVVTCVEPEVTVKGCFNNTTVENVLTSTLLPKGLGYHIEGRTIYITSGTPIAVEADEGVNGYVSLSAPLRRWLTSPISLSVRNKSATFVWDFLMTRSDTTILGITWDRYPTEQVSEHVIVLVGDYQSAEEQVTLDMADGTVADGLARLCNLCRKRLVVLTPNTLGLRRRGGDRRGLSE